MMKLNPLDKKLDERPGTKTHTKVAVQDERRQLSRACPKLSLMSDLVLAVLGLFRIDLVVK